jgi:hypothetical protein
VTYGSRIPNAEHEAQPWRVHDLVRDFELEDAWALPAHGAAADFSRLIELLAASDPAHAESAPTRFLWQLRDRLGKWFSLGRISTPAQAGGGLRIPGTDEVSLAGRLPEDLRGSAAGVHFASLPFQPLYLTANEFAAEISNQTVHGVMHLAWAERGDGEHGGQMAVYVKPRGLFGKGYMELIKPFRHWIVYPALMRQTERAWEAAGRRVG